MYIGSQAATKEYNLQSADLFWKSNDSNDDYSMKKFSK